MSAYTDDDMRTVTRVLIDKRLAEGKHLSEEILDAVAPAIAARALREAAELVSDANEQGLGLGAAYRSITRRAGEIEELS